MLLFRQGQNCVCWCGPAMVFLYLLKIRSSFCSQDTPRNDNRNINVFKMMKYSLIKLPDFLQISLAFLPKPPFWLHILPVPFQQGFPSLNRLLDSGMCSVSQASWHSVIDSISKPAGQLLTPRSSKSTSIKVM